MKAFILFFLLCISFVCRAEFDSCVVKIPIYKCEGKDLLNLIDTLIATEVRHGISNDSTSYDICIFVYDIKSGCKFRILRDNTIFQSINNSSDHWGFFEYNHHRVLLCLGRLPGSIMSLGCILPTYDYYLIKNRTSEVEDNIIDDTMPHIEIWGSIDNGEVYEFVKRDERLEIVK